MSLLINGLVNEKSLHLFYRIIEHNSFKSWSRWCYYLRANKSKGPAGENQQVLCLSQYNQVNGSGNYLSRNYV